MYTKHTQFLKIGTITLIRSQSSSISMTQNSLRLKQLMKQLDRASPSHPDKKNILDPPSTMYHIVKQMYNSYKKSNELKILQNKVYTLKINQEDTRMTDEPSASNVSVSLLCKASKISAQAVDSLISLKQYLPDKIKKDVVINVVQQLEKMKNLEGILLSYKRLLKTPECIRNEDGLYKFVEASMINSILRFQIAPEEFRLLAKFIISLPHLSNNPQILALIGELFERAHTLKDYEPLLSIYRNITAEQKNSQTDAIKIKITIPEHLQWLKKLMWEDHEYLSSILDLLKKEAISKMKILSDSSRKNVAVGVVDAVAAHSAHPQAEQGSQMDIQHPLKTSSHRNQSISDKDAYIIDFIFLILDICPELWEQFIKYHQQMNPSYQRYCKQKIQITMFSSDPFTNRANIKRWSSSILRVLIAHQDERVISGIFLSNIMQAIDIQSEEHANRIKILWNKDIRRFIALKSMEEENEVYWNSLVEWKSGCQFIDIVLEIFTFANRCVPFLKEILETNMRKDQLELYLNKLLEVKPNKFKDFILKVDQTSQGQIFEYNKFHLVRYLTEIVTPSMAVSIVREMCAYPPSRFCISIMTGFLQKFQDQNALIILAQCVRTLNLLLITRKYSELCTEFKNHLQDFSHKFKQAEPIFLQVPTEMTNQLSVFYQQRSR